MASLRELDSLPDRVRQHRQASTEAILIVEGRLDELLLRRLDFPATLFIAHTRNSVVRDVMAARVLGVNKIAGLVDADFDGLRSTIEPPVFTYPEADLEATLVIGGWFDHVVETYGSADKLEANGGIDAVRTLAVEMAKRVGALRKASADFSWGLSFDAVPINSRLKPSELALKHRPYVVALCQTSPIHPDEVVAVLESFRESNEPGEFSGKDAIRVLAVALRQKYGSTQVADPEYLLRALHLAADSRLLDTEPFTTILSELEVTVS